MGTLRHCAHRFAVPVAALLLWALLPGPAQGAEPSEPLLQQSDRLVFCGDSITAMTKYTVLVDLYLAACRPDLEVDCFQNGISGETTARFLRRLDGTLELARPSVVTSFYGFNDGGWTAYKDETGARYEADTREVVTRFQDAGVRVLLASPGMAGPELENAQEYNQTLGRLRDIARDVAKETGTAFIDVHETLVRAQEKMREREGPDYDLIGRDGAHADWQGHMAIAIAMLRGLGLGEGPIAHIEVDLGAGTATASPGHRVVGVEGDTVTIESTRYPFFFLWDNPGTNFQDMPKVARELGFFEDLDRFVLAVKDPAPGEYELKWDTVAGTFSAQELSEGINLAAHFKRTPFDGPLYQLWQLSLVKCGLDTSITIDATYRRKTLLERAPQIAKALTGSPEPDSALLALIENDPMKVHEQVREKQRSLVQPITHRISIVRK